MSVVKTHHDRDFFVLYFERAPGSDTTRELDEGIKKALEIQTRLFVIDFSGIQDLPQLALRAVVAFSKSVKRKDAVLASIGVEESLERQILQAGLAASFSIKRSLQEARALANLPPLSKATIDVQLINPFIQATVSTLEAQARAKLQAGKPRLRNPDEVDQTTEIAGVISLNSPTFRGNIALCFPTRVFLSIYSSMVGRDITELTQEVRHAAGELLNAIFGRAKEELDTELALQIQNAVPSVGQGKPQPHPGKHVAVILPFATEAGAFHIEISAAVA